MEPYRKKDASKQTPESSRRRINHVAAAILATKGGHIKEESTATPAARGYRVEEEPMSSFTACESSASSPPLEDVVTSPQSSRRRINHVAAAILATLGGYTEEESTVTPAVRGYHVKEEAMSSFTACGSAATAPRASSPPVTDFATSVQSDPFASLSDAELLASSYSLSFNDAISQFPHWRPWNYLPVPPSPSASRKSRWRVLKHVIDATLRFRSTIRNRPTPLSRSGSIDNLPDWKLISIISAGESSGVVYEVVNRQTGQTYALMELPFDASQREEISREVDVFKGFDHPNIVKCYDVVVSADSSLIYLILEPLDGSLVGVSITSESDLVSLAHQLLLGLTYLHRQKISHGDIKPSNIFFSHTGQIKLLYLGQTLSDTPPFSTEIGAMRDGFSWDIWNVGLCILKLSEGLSWPREIDALESAPASPQKQKPSLGLDLNSSDMDVKVGEDDILPPSSSNERALAWNRELLRFLISCMQVDVLEGWTAENLVHHPFFDQLPFKRERDLFHEGEELASPVKKKPKISMEDEDREYDMANQDDPSMGVPHGVPERCIKHGKLFLPDREFDREKLVRMWIAEGCIEVGVANRMEDAGILYFDALVHDGVILPSKFDGILRQMMYKFNTSKGSDVQDNYMRINARNMNENYSEALHVTWLCKRFDRTFSDALKNFKHLHTLVVHGDQCAVEGQLPSDMFLGLRLLRTLDLSCTRVAEVPYSIGKAESLRYLDLCGTPIKELPNSVDRLSFLQTLNLKGCKSLSALPRGFGKLTGLRHLDLDIVNQLRSMPKGMGNLVKLQTLQGFIVGGKNDGCGIGELKSMNEITGSFYISRLENVSNAEEAKEAALSDKKYIDKLVLRWNNCDDDDNLEDTSEILESLQPHFNLEELQLAFYSGSKLPRWISNPAYTDLTSITLHKCINCDVLPSIGELPSLKVLNIFNMVNVRNINTLFCRNHESSEVLNAFPQLEELILDSMPSLEEWSGVEDGDFPCLHRMSILYCPKLRLLPSLSHFRALEKLEISHCMELISLSEGLLPGSLESLFIRCCPGINETFLKDGKAAGSKIASVRNIWIDLERISLD